MSFSQKQGRLKHQKIIKKILVWGGKNKKTFFSVSRAFQTNRAIFPFLWVGWSFLILDRVVFQTKEKKWIFLKIRAGWSTKKKNSSSKKNLKNNQKNRHFFWIKKSIFQSQTLLVVKDWVFWPKKGVFCWGRISENYLFVALMSEKRSCPKLALLILPAKIQKCPDWFENMHEVYIRHQKKTFIRKKYIFYRAFPVPEFSLLN